MTARLIDGKKIASNIERKIKKKTSDVRMKEKIKERLFKYEG
jgi:hypothetical protein